MSVDQSKREPMPIVTLILPRGPNPECRRALKLKCDGTPIRNEDGKRQYMLCRACGLRFLTIWD
jgi:hypothetical protein